MAITRSTKRFLSIDDDRTLQLIVKQILTKSFGAQTLEVFQASTGEEGLQVMREIKPDIILCDIHMPGMDGIDTARALHKRGVPSRIIILSAFDEERFVLDAWKAGIHGYILKDTATEELVRAVRCVAEGEVWVGEGFLCRIMEKYRAAVEGKGKSREGPGGLTPREVEVLRLVAAGKRNKEIAARLFISEKTVKVHLTHIYQRLGMNDRVEVALYAIRHGVVDLTTPDIPDSPELST